MLFRWRLKSIRLKKDPSAFHFRLFFLASSSLRSRLKLLVRFRPSVYQVTLCSSLFRLWFVLHSFRLPFTPSAYLVVRLQVFIVGLF